MKAVAETAKKSKYNNRKIEADGYTFDSIAEYHRYTELKLLQIAGEISNLRVHPVYPLQKSFLTPEGKSVRSIKYEADFDYQENDVTVVEDVKGVETAVFKLKHKMFLQKYPEIVFRIIKAKEDVWTKIM